MRKRKNWIWIIYAVMLVFLYLLSSTNLFIKEKKNEIYPISLILDDETDEYCQNFKKGVDRAAVELNADVSLITLYEGEDADSQIARMAREQQDGAKALVVMPVDETALEEALADKRLQIPLVLVNAELPRDKVSSVVSTDQDALGRKLAEEMIKENGTKVPYYLFYTSRQSSARTHFQNGLEAVLTEQGCDIKRFGRHGDGSFRKAVEELVYPKAGQAVIAALDAQALLETAKILADSSVYREHVKGLYGSGTNTAILNFLDRGVISGLCVTDDYNAGYLSVRRAIELLSNQNPPAETVLKSFYIQKEDLRKPEFEKMLYPIE